MPKYLIEASYTLEGVKGVQSAGGTSRRDAVAKAEGRMWPPYPRDEPACALSRDSASQVVVVAAGAAAA